MQPCHFYQTLEDHNKPDLCRLETFYKAKSIAVCCISDSCTILYAQKKEIMTLSHNLLKLLARSAGFEPATYGFVAMNPWFPNLLKRLN